jgi:hypothetical protein
MGVAARLVHAGRWTGAEDLNAGADPSGPAALPGIMPATETSRSGDAATKQPSRQARARTGMRLRRAVVARGGVYGFSRTLCVGGGAQREGEDASQERNQRAS